MKKKQMCVDFQSKLSGVTNIRQEFMVCQIKSHFSIVCRFSLFSPFFMADFVGVYPYKKGISTVCYCKVIEPAILFRDCKKVTKCIL